MKGKKSKKLLLVVMALVVVFSMNSVAFADSGVSALPQETPLQSYCYKHIAPKTQTSYKTIYSMTNSVAKISTINKKIMATASATNDIGGGYGVVGFVVKRLPFTQEIGVVCYVGGKAVYKICEKSQKSLDACKENTKIKTVVSFKWTNAKALKYSVQIEEYFVFKGKKVGDSKVKYITGKCEGLK